MLTKSIFDRNLEHAQVDIPIGRDEVRGDLILPADARGIVVFAHGSGSSRKSPRNRYVAKVLRNAGFGTLLMDLLTDVEEAYDARTAELRFDIPLLAQRLVAATDWVMHNPETELLSLGYFGASTGAAAAIEAAVQRPRFVQAIVSRGGRPDLATLAAQRLQASVLLIVGSRDTRVLDLNRDVLQHIPTPKQLTIVSGASHLFEEPGALERVAELAREWFLQHLAVRTPARELAQAA